MGRRQLGVGFVVLATLVTVGACSAELVGRDDAVSDGGADGNDGGPPTEADGATSTDAPPDAPLDAPSTSCNGTSMFGPPTPVLGLEPPGAAMDRYPTLSLDELEILFSSTRDAPMPEAIYRARRLSRTQPFGSPAKLIQTNNDVSTHPMLARDGTHLFFSRRPSSGGAADVWLGYRTPPPTDTFDPGQPVAGGVNVVSTHEMAPFLAIDGALWYARQVSTSKTFEILRALPSDPTTFDNPTIISELAAPGTNESVERIVLGADQRVAYVAKTLSPEQPNLDMYVAERQTPTGKFLVVKPLSELNAGGEDVPGFVSEDGCRLYFHSTRAGMTRIYVAERSP